MKTITTILIGIISTVSYADDLGPKTSAVKEMFNVMGIDKQMKGGFEAMLPMIDQMSQQMHLNDEEKEELKNIYRDWFDNDIDRDSMVEKLVMVYSEAFTLDEISEVTAFYQTLTGLKFLKKSPELMQIGVRLGMQEAQSKQSELMAKLQPFMEKHQNK